MRKSKQPALYTVFIGPAGSGKTSLAYALGKWLEESGYAADYVNFDPGCENLPYQPNFDIRTMFTIGEIMKEERIGPNAAIIRAVQLMKEKSDKIIGEISRLEQEHILVDIPGQMEVFLFHEAGPELLRRLEKLGRVIAIFILDATFASNPSGLAVAELLANAVELHLGIPTITALNKSDVKVREDLDRLISEPGYLEAVIKSESEGLIKDLIFSILKAISSVKGSSRIVKVSAKTGEGLDELYSIIHEVFCACGDLS
ncbi:MAG: ATP/GTP-binding protein [Candidatus Hodarchaeota archaeon]